MKNEFGGTKGWGCPGTTGAGNEQCSYTGEEVLDYWSVLDINKWVSLVILAGMALLYRGIFAATLKLKEMRSK
jgi:hypothetical protein